MGRKSLWKTFDVETRQEARNLAAAWRSSSKAFGPGKIFNWDGVTGFETNLSWKDLRMLVSHSGIKVDFRNGIVADTLTTEERYGKE